MRNALKIATAFYLFGLSACNVGNNSDPSQARGTGGALNGTGSSVNGTWKTTCVKSNGSPTAPFLQTQVQFNNGIQSVSFKRYFDGSCTQLGTQSTATLKYTLGKTRSDGTIEFDAVVSDIVLSYHSPEFVAEANNIKAYGYDDWKQNVGKSVLGRTDDGTADSDFQMKIYSLVKVSGDSLSLGDCPKQANTCKGDTPETRHTQLETTRVFKRSN